MKVVAILLFVVEILWFICLPVFRELKEWWAMKAQLFRSKRSLISLAILAGILGFLFVPITNSISVVGVLHAEKEMNIYAPYPARLVKLNVKNMTQVAKGKTLAVFESDELDLKVALLEKRISLLQRQIDRSGRDEIDRANRLVLESRFAGLQTELSDLHIQQEQLVLKADMDGVVADLPNFVHVGRYVDLSKPLFRLRGPDRVAVAGLIPEADLDRIATGASGTFYPDNVVLAKVDVRLSKINNVSSRKFSFPAMSNRFGGSVSTVEQNAQEGTLRVDGSYYGLDFEIMESDLGHYDQTQRGVVHIAAEPKSFAMRAFQQIGSVLIRETGF